MLAEKKKKMDSKTFTVVVVVLVIIVAFGGISMVTKFSPIWLDNLIGALAWVPVGYITKELGVKATKNLGKPKGEGEL